MFWSAVSFGTLLFLLKRYAFPAITEMLDARERTIAQNLAKAEQARKDAEQLLAEYQAKLKTAQQEATAMLDQARKQGQQSGIIEREAPIHISNVMLYDPKAERGTRVGVRVMPDGTRERVSRASGETLPKGS